MKSLAEMLLECADFVPSPLSPGVVAALKARVEQRRIDTANTEPEPPDAA